MSITLISKMKESVGNTGKMKSSDLANAQPTTTMRSNNQSPTNMASPVQTPGTPVQRQHLSYATDFFGSGLLGLSRHGSSQDLLFSRLNNNSNSVNANNYGMLANGGHTGLEEDVNGDIFSNGYSSPFPPYSHYFPSNSLFHSQPSADQQQQQHQQQQQQTQKNGSSTNDHWFTDQSAFSLIDTTTTLTVATPTTISNSIKNEVTTASMSSTLRPSSLNILLGQQQAPYSDSELEVLANGTVGHSMNGNSYKEESMSKISQADYISMGDIHPMSKNANQLIQRQNASRRGSRKSIVMKDNVPTPMQQQSLQAQPTPTQIAATAAYQQQQQQLQNAQQMLAAYFPVYHPFDPMLYMQPTMPMMGYPAAFQQAAQNAQNGDRSNTFSRGTSSASTSNSSTSLSSDDSQNHHSTMSNYAMDISSLNKRPRHVVHACTHCKKAHLACDEQRPCGRCLHLGRTDCVNVIHKKRGRPRLSTKDDENHHGPISATSYRPIRQS